MKKLTRDQMVFRIQLATKKVHKRNKKCHEYDFGNNTKRLQEYIFFF